MHSAGSWNPLHFNTVIEPVAIGALLHTHLLVLLLRRYGGLAASGSLSALWFVSYVSGLVRLSPS